nr:MAG: hypothetical protein [Caudoviricetes sp.]
MISFKSYLSDQVISEAIEYHLSEKVPFDECVFRYGSEKYFEFFLELKELYSKGLLESVLSEDEIEILESDIGEFVEFEGENVPLDFIMEEATPELNKPKRGGPKKFQVFIRDPSTKKIKRIAFGDTSGLTVKYDNPERKKAFAARHNCSSANDKTTPKFWSCRINRYLAKTPAGRRGYW